MQNTKAYIMLVCATSFWAGNFMVGKFAFLTNIPPMSLVFYRWSLVWLILLPFTYKELIKNNKRIMETDVRTRPGLNFIRWNQIDWIEVILLTVFRLQRKIYKTANLKIKGIRRVN